MSGFTISASEYQALIARRDIRIAELMARLAKYEQPDDAEPVPDSTEDCTTEIDDDLCEVITWLTGFGDVRIKLPDGAVLTKGTLRLLLQALRGEP